MSISRARFIRRWAERLPKSEYRRVPLKTRGIYALLQAKSAGKFDVVYIGMAASGGIRRRLRSHKKKTWKRSWSHFTIFEVWDNITPGEVKEIEGLFREIYSGDSKANRFNKQKKYKELQNVREDDLTKWKKDGRGDSK